VTAREGAEVVVRTLRGAGYRAYWVGGCVRDLLMGRQPHDYDIATDAPPEVVAGLFARVHLVGVRFGVVVVTLDGHRYEVTTFRAEGPYADGRHPSRVEFADPRADAQRRDFTVNGLLYDPLTGEVVDHVGGQADIAGRLIRTIGPPQVRFAEDRLRMLRAVRLAAELQFDLEEQTHQAIVAEAPRIVEVSAERIRDELLRLLTSPGRGRGVRLLQATGLLHAVLPEVAATVGVPQPPEFHPEGDVFTHTVLTLEHVRDPSPVLALAALLHDIGKPLTLTRSDRIRFHEHDRVGAELAEEVCRRLRLSAEEAARVVELVRDHLRVRDLPRMRPARAARFLLGPHAADHLELHRADCLASHGDLSVYQWAQQTRRRLLARPPGPRLLTGDDLIALGYPPGPQFREILDAVEDARLDGRVATREEAVAWVRQMFPRPAPPQPGPLEEAPSGPADDAAGPPKRAGN
jgi:poly(A) polymerase